jgi:ribosomal protein L1
MPKRGKNHRSSAGKVDRNRQYEASEAITLLKECMYQSKILLKIEE